MEEIRTAKIRTSKSKAEAESKAKALARRQARGQESWYSLVERQLVELIPIFGVEQSAGILHRAFQIICRQSLGPCGPPRLRSTLNHDGTPVQFALTLSRARAPLQFLSESGDPRLSPAGKREVLADELKTLVELLQLKGDRDELSALLKRASAIDAHAPFVDQGDTFWIGASVAPNGKSGVKIYINGKLCNEGEQWVRLKDFATYFGALAHQRELARRLSGRMTPLGMALVLTQDEEPAGRVYFAGYGNHVRYYADLLQHFNGEQSQEQFQHFAEVMLDGNCAHPTQSVVVSAGFSPGFLVQPDLKVEFCGLSLFDDDRQARHRCLRWLTLQDIDTRPYTALLDVIGEDLRADVVNLHVYLGLGWKRGAGYTSIYLKPHPAHFASIAW